MKNCCIFLSLTVTFLSVAEISAEDGHRSSYYKDGEIHINVLGTPEKKPIPFDTVQSLRGGSRSFAEQYLRKKMPPIRDSR